ncbi:MAG: helix-turn-helix domain-containing protein [Eubacteriales bacterium]
MNDTRQKIIDAAKELFSTKGYAATTTKDIAGKAGISEVTLFRHFESKRNLFMVAVHSTFEADILINFFEKDLTYDIERDLKKLSGFFYTLYKDNAKLMKMHIKDKDSEEISEFSKPKVEMKVRTLSDEYFQKMHDMGVISDEPIMCRKYFFSNVFGFLMRKFILEKTDDGTDYFNWMVEKTITAIKTDSSKTQKG